MAGIPRFLEMVDEVRKLHISKNQDYAADKNPYANFDGTEAGISLFYYDRDKVFAWPIFNKLTRLSNLIRPNKKVNHESIADSCKDIAVYALIWACDLERRFSNVADNGDEEISKLRQLLREGVSETGRMGLAEDPDEKREREEDLTESESDRWIRKMIENLDDSSLDRINWRIRREKERRTSPSPLSDRGFD